MKFLDGLHDRWVTVKMIFPGNKNIKKMTGVLIFKTLKQNNEIKIFNNKNSYVNG